MPLPIAAQYALRPSELGEALTTLIELRQPVMVWGGPGLGKSDIAQSVTAALGRIYVDVRLLYRNPVDIHGFPYRDAKTNTMHWTRPDILLPEGSKEKYVVNLEELSSCPPMVQAAAYELVLDRRIGSHKLPEGAAVIACGNRLSDRGVVHRMATPLVSRFVHLTIKPDISDWVAWAASAGLSSAVIFFLQMSEDLLYVFPDGSQEVTGFPTPRTWEFVSRIVGDDPEEAPMPPAIERSMIYGTVGPEAGQQFLAFLDVMRDVPHPAEVLANPATCAIPAKVDVLMALCGSLYRVADHSNMDAICTFAARLRAELAKFLVTQCVRRDTTLRNTSAFIDWQMKDAA